MKGTKKLEDKGGYCSPPFLGAPASPQGPQGKLSEDTSGD